MMTEATVLVFTSANYQLAVVSFGHFRDMSGYVRKNGVDGIQPQGRGRSTDRKQIQ